MDLDEITFEAEEKMESAVRVLGERFQTVRTGRASSGLVENVRVEYYGVETPLKQLAAISVPDPQMMVIKPFDPSVVKGIEKAILASDVGITPSVEGRLIRLMIPPLSEERRKQLAAQVRDLAEQTRIAIRNVRRDANKEVGKAGKDKLSGVSEDGARDAKDEIQELTRKYEAKVNELTAKKSKDIMEF